MTAVSCLASSLDIFYVGFGRVSRYRITQSCIYKGFNQLNPLHHLDFCFTSFLFVQKGEFSTTGKGSFPVINLTSGKHTAYTRISIS